MGLLSKRADVDTSGVQEKHEDLIGINKTVTEYAALIEQVSTDRADLLLEISQLQIKNAELSVSKALFEPLETELQELREQVEEYKEYVESARTLERELRSLRRLYEDKTEELRQVKLDHDNETASLRRELATAKGQVTRLKNKQADVVEGA